MTAARLLLIFVLFAYGTSTAQTWKWAKIAGSTKNDAALDVAADNVDNFYAVGNFTDSANFDGQLLTAFGKNSFFVKYNQYGSKIWAFTFPGLLRKVCIDPQNSNNIIVAGTFTGSINIGSTTLNAIGSTDCYAFKVDSSGNILWSTSWGGDANDSIYDIEYQLTGNIVATGTFNSSILFLKDGITTNQVYDSSLTNNLAAANLYSAHFKDADGKALKVYKTGVFTGTGGDENIHLRFDADIRGNLGLVVLKGQIYGSWGAGSITVGGNSYPYTYLTLRLDSTCIVKETLATAKRTVDQYYDHKPQFGTSHLDKNSVFYIDVSYFVFKLNPPFAGYEHDERLSSINLVDRTTYTGDVSGCFSCDFPPSITPFGIHNNRIVFRRYINTSPAIYRIQSAGNQPPWTKTHNRTFEALTHLMNSSGNKVFVTGEFQGASTSLDNIPIQPIGGKDAYMAVLEIPAQTFKADAGADRTNCNGNGTYIGGTPVAVGGNLPYTYNWQPATGLSNPNIPYPFANPSTTTPYVLSVTDGTGIISRDTVMVYVGEIAPASITPTNDTTICANANVTYTASFGYAYRWSNGATTRSITVNTPGSYYVTIYNNCGDSIQSAAVLLQTIPIPPATITGATIFCEGDSTLLSAPAGYSYLWNTGDTTQSIWVDTTKTVRVTVSNGICAASSNFQLILQIRPPAKPVITPASPVTFCGSGGLFLLNQSFQNILWSNGSTGNQTNITASGNYWVTVRDGYGVCPPVTSDTHAVIVNPVPPVPVITSSAPMPICMGTPLTLTAPSGYQAYQWATQQTTQSVTYTPTQQTFNWVRVTNQFGCTRQSAVLNITVMAPNLPVPVITASGPTSFCQGDSVILTAPGGYTYVWSTGATTQSITAKTSGNYSVRVYQGSQCSNASAPVTVTVSNQGTPPVITASGATTFCDGGSVTLSAPAGFTYAWSNGATTQNIVVSNSGNFTVTTTNASGCSGTSAPMQVTVNTAPAVPVITANGATTFCEGGSVILSAPAGFSYAWSNGATSQNISVNSTGNFSVTVVNAAGCSKTSLPTTVTVNAAPPAPVVTSSGPTTFCEGGSVTLSAPSGFNYQWSNGATSQQINVSSSGNYSVTVSNAVGCSNNSATTNVSVNPLPSVPVITSSGATTFCEGGNVTLSALAGYTYLWSNGSTSESINVTTTGNYSVTVTNANGCSRSSNATSVTVSPYPPVPTISQVGNTLYSSAASGNQWYFNGNIINGATSSSYAFTAPGNYTVTVTNNTGCATSSQAFSAARNISIDITGNERFHYQVMPNPVGDQMTIRYTLEQTHVMSIILISINGSTIPVQSPVQRQAGTYSVNANDIVAKLQNGEYFIRFLVDNKQVLYKIIKL